MKNIIIGVLIAVGVTGFVYAGGVHTYSPLRASVTEFNAAPVAAQLAIVVDVCGNEDELMDTDEAGKKLSVDDKRAYEMIRTRLGRAYSETIGTDGTLAKVTRDFCDALDD